ncbi:MAG: PEP-CTERM sorting domain-containing protein [Bryobacteraceae bacterium]
MFLSKHARYWFFSVLALTLFFAPTRALGDSLSLDFNIPDSLFPPPGASPWATLSLNLNPDNSISVDVSVVAGLDVTDFTFNTTSSSIAISGQPTNWFLTDFPTGACAGNPAYGCFDGWVTTELFGVTPNPVSDLSFIVTTPSGFSSVNQLVGLNYSASVPVDFEVVLESPSGGFSDAYALATAVPEPSTLLLLGSVLLCFVALAARSKRLATSSSIASAVSGG